MATQRLAPDLGGTIDTTGPRHVVGHTREILGHLVVTAGGNRLIRRHLLEAAHHVAAAGEHHPLHAGQPRRLEHVVGANNVARQLPLPVVASQIRRQVHHHVLPGESGFDSLRVGDVSLETTHAVQRTAVQGTEFIAATHLQMLPQQAADQPGHAGNKDFFHVKCSPF